jgi:hypothetical protein
MTHQSRSIGVSAASTLLLAIMPKCPLCWMALLATIGVSWPVSSEWLRSFVIALSLVPLALLLFRARRAHDYRPFTLGVIAATGLYVFKFWLALDAGVYLSGAALFALTLWSPKLISHRTNEITCHCYPLELRTEKPMLTLSGGSAEDSNG